MTIAVDSFGPVTDNAQSVYELSQIEARQDISAEIEKDFGFKPDFENAKYQLEKGDGAGNTFKATAKPVLIGTAVVGATTMVFGIIMLLDNIGMSGDPSFSIISKLSLVQPEIILGLLMGGAVIYWFTGASTARPSSPAPIARSFTSRNTSSSTPPPPPTRTARKSSASAPSMRRKACGTSSSSSSASRWRCRFSIRISSSAISIGIAFFGLFQAIFMANAGGAWDNAKKIVEVDLRQKGTDLHAATVVGDTVGDPFKDTSSVAMNPVIKFTTLFGLLAVEIAVTMTSQDVKTWHRRASSSSSR